MVCGASPLQGVTWKEWKVHIFRRYSSRLLWHRRHHERRLESLTQLDGPHRRRPCIIRQRISDRHSGSLLRLIEKRHHCLGLQFQTPILHDQVISHLPSEAVYLLDILREISTAFPLLVPIRLCSFFVGLYTFDRESHIRSLDGILCFYDAASVDAGGLSAVFQCSF